MSVTTTKCSVRFTGEDAAGVTKFAADFPVAEKTHLLVTRETEEGDAGALVLGQDYDVAIILDSKNFSQRAEVTLLTPLSAGQALSINRIVPIVQETRLAGNKGYFPEEVERALDILTMIAQQLHDKLARALLLPDAYTSEQVFAIIVNSAAEVQRLMTATKACESAVAGILKTLGDPVGGLAATKSKVDNMALTLAGKSDKGHGHAIGDIQNLVEALAAKADDKQIRELLNAKANAQEIAEALAGKATAESLAEKADAIHAHEIDQITNLAETLSRKVEDNDPRLADSRSPLSHAESHHTGGADRIRPEDIDAMPPAPGDGKNYFARGAEWAVFVPPADGPITDHSMLSNLDAPNVHPQSSIKNLAQDLSAIREDLTEDDNRIQALQGAVATKADAAAVAEHLVLKANASEVNDALARKAEAASVAESLGQITDRLQGNAGRLDTLDNHASALSDRLGTAESGISSLGGRFNALGAMSAAGDAPNNGKPHLRQDGGWIEAAGGGSGGGAIVGEIRLLPFRATALPEGWYFCNGDRYSLATAQGDALNSLPAQLKTDWGIGASGGSINLPSLFDAAGGGYFLRPVDNATRVPGHKQTDAIRNITGSWSFDSRVGLVWANTPLGRAALSGAFTSPAPSKINSFATQPTGAASVADLYFDASGSVPVAPENRPVNIGMTPAIYLGV